MIIILLQLSEKLWRYIIISELQNDIFLPFFKKNVLPKNFSGDVPHVVIISPQFTPCLAVGRLLYGWQSDWKKTAHDWTDTSRTDGQTDRQIDSWRTFSKPISNMMKHWHSKQQPASPLGAPTRIESFTIRQSTFLNIIIWADGTIFRPWKWGNFRSGSALPPGESLLSQARGSKSLFISSRRKLG